MSNRATLLETEGGLVPRGAGWFVVNAKDALWTHHETLGSRCTFEGVSTSFSDFGFNIRVLEAGQHNCMYHSEDQPEAFLVVAGTCLLILDGEERELRSWDFVYCPPLTSHVFVGSGPGSCVIAMVGSRAVENPTYVYPVAEAAIARGAGVRQETTDPEEAYSQLPERQPGACRSGSLPDCR